MALSKRSLRGVYAMNKLQRLNIKYLEPQLSAHEDALNVNKRFDIEKAQKEARICQINKLFHQAKSK